MTPRMRRSRCRRPHPGLVGFVLGDRHAVAVGGAAGVGRNIAAGGDDLVEGGAVDRQVPDQFEGAGPKGFDHQHVPVVKMAHVQLAKAGSLFGPVRPAVDHAPTTAANPLSAIMVKGDRFFAVKGQLLVDHIEHLQKTHICRHFPGPVSLQPAFGGSILLSPDPQLQVDCLGLGHYL
jgi:hypothetical protein